MRIEICTSSACGLSGPVPPPKQPSYLRFDETSDAAAKRFIHEFVGRAFRRPVTAVERHRFFELYQAFRQQGQMFYPSIRAVAQAALISPQFLYRIEVPPTADRIRNLDDFERATALSYFIWSSMPDDELLELARARRLSEPDVWREQIVRLLRSPRSEALVDQFATQWLNLRLLADAEPDQQFFPDADRELLQDMTEETSLFVKDVFRRDASILELLDANFTYLNERLAGHYGLDGIQGTDFQRVSLDQFNRRGVLTHASILTLTSNPDRTSPVKRGKWIMENILGDAPPPAPADVTPLESQEELVGTLRQRMVQHRADPSCASCHATMDAFGFALENYDAVGRFRLHDGDLPIDAVGELPDGTVIDGSAGLQQQLKTRYRAKFIRSFTEKLLIYALGRGLKYYDRCTLEQIMKQAADDEYRLSAFVIAVAESETFLKRSASMPAGSGKK